MKKLRRKFDRFCILNHNKGIPNLMLYIAIGCGVVSAMSMLGYSQLYSLLCFDRASILRGQVWRLFTYVFTMSGSNYFTTLILLYCIYSLGRAVEASWGTLKFNLYYVFGILLMDIYALVFDGSTYLYDFQNGFSASVSMGIPGYYAANMTFFLHLSMVLCYATLYPDSQFLLFYVIPIKAWVLSLLYFVYILYSIISVTIPVMYLPHNLFPLVALANYFLFFGKDVVNLLPLSWQVKRKKTVKRPVQGGPIPFRPAEKKEEVPYTHRCTVCGKTDASHPGLEFRYCSRCSGYYCYCEEHINNHTHIE